MIRNGLALLLLASVAQGAVPAPQVLDSFEASAGWSAMPASGVEMKLSTEPGPHGNALRVDFHFTKGGGYAVLHRALDVALPENYRIEFQLRGETAAQNLEFKLLDASGENVWWSNRVNHEFSREWTTERIRKRQISFAWGPKGGGELSRAAALEFAITAGSGGSGTVWFDELTLVPMAPPADPVPPVASATSSSRGHLPSAVLDEQDATWWAAAPTDRAPTLTLDLGGSREFGGLSLKWAAGGVPRAYAIELDEGAGTWRTVREVRGSDGDWDDFDLPDSEARGLRIRTIEPGRRTALATATIQPLDWAPNPDRYWMRVASRWPRGYFPRGFYDEQVYWTVLGEDGDREEALIDEDGRVETGKSQWSLEPFLRTEKGLRTWSESNNYGTLEEESLPMPHAVRLVDSLALIVSTFTHREGTRSMLVVRYRVQDWSRRRRSVDLHVALRPFAVNPPSQWLNMPGAGARIRSLEPEPGRIRVNGDRAVEWVGPPPLFRAMTGDERPVVARLVDRDSMSAGPVHDPQGRATGLLSWRLEVPAGGEREATLIVPFGEALAPLGATPERITAWEDSAKARWRRALGTFSFSGSWEANDVMQTVRAQLGYVLVNRDSVGIQPGSRSYERSWIRDGSLTSSALLRSGMREPVRDYLRWYAQYQYADGKVPCCVDHRGSDPVPENDSHGEFIFLAAEYLRLTGDRETVEAVYPNVRAAAAYMDTLRAQRRTPEWRTPANAPFFGLLPPSISHEGYSAKPMHSYWDDLFALRGYKDAVWLAETLGHTEDVAWLRASRDTFARDFGAAVRATLKAKDIRYIPGCSDLGDFDPTSTTIALSPVQAGSVLPDDALKLTFERYWEFFSRRKNGSEVWDAYTPYEMRNIGAFVRLGWTERAHDLLDWFLADRRPVGWRHWAEVVDKDPRHARFLGDMPHTWCGTDFVRSVQEMIAYEDERDSSLVLGAGLLRRWIGAGFSVSGLESRWGTVNYRLVRTTWNDELVSATLDLSAMKLRVPPGGLVIPLLKQPHGSLEFNVRLVYPVGPVVEWSAYRGDRLTIRPLSRGGTTMLPTRIEWRPKQVHEIYR